ncbi:MAG: hypothetical protein LBL55_09955 [Propionibacteriaceae bacterium]|jgi:hypothetical protein|nr:hypothetical protein [Propionibacteriaceae bacterium]
MREASPVRWAGLALLLGLTWAAAGCAGSDQPSGPSSDPSAAIVDQKRSADEFLLCLSDYAVPASLRDFELEGSLVVWEPTASVVARDQNGQELIYSVPGTEPLAPEVVETALQGGWALEDETLVVLVIDQVDYSTAYATCLDASGYHQPAAVSDPEAETGQSEAIRQESNRWADCARQNGWPDVADAGPVGLSGLSEVVIPSRIDEAGLRALLTACPPYDAAGYAVAAEAWAQGDTDYPAPAFPYLTIAEPDPVKGDWEARNQLLDLLNQLQSEAYAAAVNGV